MAIEKIGNGIYTCLSSDDKSLITNEIENALFIERDTGRIYKSSGGNPALTTHVHSGADITSGTVPATQLPTGNTTTKGALIVATDGEVNSAEAVSGNDSRLSNARTPTAHATSHKSGGSDVVKLDELGAPTDVTTLNVSTSAHGLTPKLPNDGTKYLDGVGTWTTPAGGGGGAPTGASYVTLSNDGTLSAERVLTAGTNIAVVDGGAGTTATLNVPNASTTVKGAAELATDGENASGVVVQGNDARLSDARTPTAHAASHISSGSDPIAIATTSVRGTVELATDGENAANVVVQGNDSRLSNSRTPTTHKDSHKSGGSDAFVKGDDLIAASRYLEDVADMASDAQRVWIEDATANLKYWSDEGTPVKHVVERQANKGAASGYASLDSGTLVPVAQLPAGTTTAKGTVELATDGENAANVVVQGNDARLSDSRTPTAHKNTHKSGGSDPFVKGDDLDASSKYLEDVADMASDAQRIWLEDATANLKYWSDEGTPVKHTVERQANKGAVSGYASLDSSTLVPVAQLPAGTTTTKGVVELATDAENAANVVVQGNDSRLSNSRTPTAHKDTHKAGGSDPFVKGDDLNASSRYLEDVADMASDPQRIWIDDGTASLKYWSDEASPVKHTVERQANKSAASGYASLDGSTKVPVAELPDATTTTKGIAELATSGENAANVVVQGNDSRLSDARTPTAHATSHKSGGSDSIKLDELAAPTDVATLNSSTSAHGLLKKLDNTATNYMDGTGNWSVPAGGGSGAPTGASYLTLGTDATLTSERVLTAGTDIGFTDAGAGGALTIAAGANVLNTTNAKTVTTKTIDKKDNVLISTNPETFNIWKVSTTYYAANNTTGAITSNSSFATLINNVITSVTAGAPMKIIIAEGDFDIAAQVLIAKARIGNISIVGAGAGLTNFIITSAWNGASVGTKAISIGEAPTIAAGITGTLTANLAKSALTCTMSTTDSAKFAVGDYILIKSSAMFSSDVAAAAKQGEIKRVAAVNTGTGVLTFDVPAFDAYTTANTSVVYKLSNFISNITLEGVTIKRGSGLNFTNGVVFCEFAYVDNAQLRDVELIDNVTNYDSGINLKSCINSNVDGLMLRQTTAATYNLQYGLEIGACCQNISVTNIRAFGRFRHAAECSNGNTIAAFSGVCRGVTHTNIMIEGAEVGAIDNHCDGENINYTNCTVLGTTQSTGNVGFEIRSRKTTLTNCNIRAAMTIGFQFSGDAHDSSMIGCVADSNIEEGVRLVNDLSGVKRFTMIGCHLINNGNNGFRSDSNCTQMTLIGNYCNSNSNNGMYILDCSNVILNANVVNSNTNEGIWLDATTTQTNVKLFSNDVSSNGSNGILINPFIIAVHSNNTGYVGLSTFLDMDPMTRRTGSYQPAAGSGASTVGAVYGMLSAHTVTGGGTNTNTFDTTEGVLMNLQSAASSGVNAGLVSNTAGVGITRRIFGARAKIRCKVDSTTTCRFFFGFTSNSTLAISETPLAVGDSGILVGFNAADTNYQIYSNDGATSVTKTAITGPIAKNANFHTIEIMWLASGNITVIFDGVPQTISSDLPATTANLYFNAVAQTSAATARTLSVKGVWLEAEK